MSNGQRAEALPGYLYSVGQSVTCKAPFASKPLGQCKVTAVLPHLGDDLQYRIRSEHEAFERVVVEHQLSDWALGDR